MSEPKTYSSDTPVEAVQTHGAMVFLVGDEAYKIKRPVHYDYLDFTAFETRRMMLQRELELNKPSAPEIYLGLVPITQEADGRLALNGTGEVAEWALHMRRFPATAELSRVAERGELNFALAEEIGRAIADYHAGIELREADGTTLVTEIAAEFRREFSGMADIFLATRIEQFHNLVDAAISAHASLLSARSRAGHVRRGHGDLHLGNMVLLDGHPVPFDALEFDERLGTLDVLYDLAFVIMDLLHGGLRRQANAVLNAYLYRANEPDHFDGLAVLPLFLGIRAGVRAMVLVQAGRTEGKEAETIFEKARAYLDHAIEYLSPATPRLVAVGGFSGTGKTTIARHLAPDIDPAPGAIHLRSDLERKALFGVDPLTRLPQNAYDAKIGRQVYARLLDRAERSLRAGHSVVLDAVYSAVEERRALAALAERCDVRLTGLWLQAGEAVLLRRVAERRGDASDADEAVVRRQLDENKIAAPDWVQVGAEGAIPEVLHKARSALGIAV